ncbi:hypothetical protein GYMLUDRAFT_35857 [Collybiopsis luxurians FD-317 M1]|nr:hypothetical protein GYMLUDRAFT_35857 [Collybiopsis luxurians FD-317 M1]
MLFVLSFCTFCLHLSGMAGGHIKCDYLLKDVRPKLSDTAPLLKLGRASRGSAQGAAVRLQFVPNFTAHTINIA